MSDRRTLLLVGHGFPGRPEARHPAEAHADRLDAPDPFDTVEPALVKGDPALAEQVRSLPPGRGVVVPLFLSNGYFVGEAIPALLSAHRPAGVTLSATPPIGTHPDLTGVIVRRALSAADRRLPDVALALVGHGSDHGDANRAAVEEHARRIRDGWDFASVSSWFLEEDPELAALPAAVGTDGVDAAQLAVVPVFVGAGHHVREDIPAALDLTDGRGEIDGTPVSCTAPVGSDPRVAGIVLDRALAALADEGREEAAVDPGDKTTVQRRYPS